MAKEKYFIFNLVGDFLFVGFVIDSGIRFSLFNNVKFSDYEKVEFFDNRVMFILKYKRVKDG